MSVTAINQVPVRPRTIGRALVRRATTSSAAARSLAAVTGGSQPALGGL